MRNAKNLIEEYLSEGYWDDLLDIAVDAVHQVNGNPDKDLDIIVVSKSVRDYNFKGRKGFEASKLFFKMTYYRKIVTELPTDSYRGVGYTIRVTKK